MRKKKNNAKSKGKKGVTGVLQRRDKEKLGNAITRKVNVLTRRKKVEVTINKDKQLKDVSDGEDIEVINNISQEQSTDGGTVEETQKLTETEQNIEYYELIPKQLLAIVIPPTIRTVGIRGTVGLKPAMGYVSILGYKMGPLHPFVPVYSLPPSSTLPLHLLPPSPPSSALPPGEWKKVLRRQVRSTLSTLLVRGVSPLCATLIRDFISATPAGYFVLLAQPLPSSPSLSYTSHYYPKLKEGVPYPCAGKPSNHPNNFGFSVTLDLATVINITDSYRKVKNDLITSMTGSRESVLTRPPVVLVCGGKNSGKSTFCRYLINSLLSECSGMVVCENDKGRGGEVLYLECDPGQTELTPPGVISIHSLREPLLGPPHSHPQLQSRPALVQAYLGVLSVQDSANQYLQCVKFVIERLHLDFAHLSTRLPLVINTMGWNSGLGLLLLSDVIREMCPTHVIRMDSDLHPTRNMPPLTPLSLSTNQVDTWRPLSGAPRTEHTQYEVISVTSASSGKRLPGFSAADEREFTLVSYLSSMQPLHHVLTPVNQLTHCLYWISFGDIALTICHHPGSVSYQHILYVFNASLVALCHADISKATQPGGKQNTYFFEEPPACECLGFGIIRCFDMSRRRLCLLTPVKISVLKKVNTLMRGDVTIPQTLVNHQQVAGTLPYSSRSKGSAIGSGRIVGRAYQHSTGWKTVM